MMMTARLPVVTPLVGSTLCDGPRFARYLMAVLREAWRQWAAA